MSPNLLELAQNYFLGSTVRQISTAFGEPEARLSAALRSVVPLVLGGLLARAQEPGGAAELLDSARQVHEWGLLSDLSSLLTSLSAPAAGSLPGRGADLLPALLGTNYAPAAASISQQTGVPTTTVGNLFSVAVAAVLGLLGRHCDQNNLDASGLSSYLSSQRAAVADALAALPAGLGPASTRLAPAAPAASAAPAPPVLAPGRDTPIPMRPSPTAVAIAPTVVLDAQTVEPGVSASAADTSPASASVPPITPSVPAAEQPAVRPQLPRPAVRPAAPVPVAARRWPWLLLLAVGLIAAGYFGLSRRPPQAASEPVATPTASPAPAHRAAPARRVAPAGRVHGSAGEYEAATGIYRYEAGADTTLQLPTGAGLTAGSHSAEAQLWQLLADSTQLLTSIQNQGGIPLDRVYFAPGQATLTAASRGQLAHLATLLTAFPRASLKFGGFTDNQGPAEASLLLSADRANAVRRALVAQGIAPTRVAAQGYGQTHPIASNDTPAGQAQNRRIAVLLTSK